MVVRTQSIIEFQNSNLVTKNFSTLQKYLLRVISNILANSANTKRRPSSKYTLLQIYNKRTKARFAL